MAENANWAEGMAPNDELRNWLTALTWELEQARQEYASLSRELQLLKHDLRMAHADRRRSVKRLSRPKRRAS